MAPDPGTRTKDISVDIVSLGSFTSSRIEDLREAANVLSGKKIAQGITLIFAPGSVAVKMRAEEEGLDLVLLDAGGEWRGAGCSICLGMNPDQLKPGERWASTSNRNFQRRQGVGCRTHLISPAAAAAMALSGRLSSPSDLLSKS
jgi:3-isopropylmalate/(R)-2-methylmalate dehydratase large subunit